jgi:hypothetical protein
MSLGFAYNRNLLTFSLKPASIVFHAKLSFKFSVWRHQKFVGISQYVLFSGPFYPRCHFVQRGSTFCFVVVLLLLDTLVRSNQKAVLRQSTLPVLISNFKF